jgi:hypothetical protein
LDTGGVKPRSPNAGGDLMNSSLLRKILHLILAALLLTSILMMAGTTAAAKKHYRRHQRPSSFIVRPAEFEPRQKVEPARQWSTFGPFGQAYHPYFDPYGSYNHYTFYRRSIKR